MYGEIVGYFSRRVAHALNGCNEFAVLLEILPFGRCTEDVNAFWPRDRRLPAIEWIVVAVDYERLNSGFCELGKTVSEAQLCSNRAIGAIVNVTSDYEEVGILVNAKID